MTEEARGFMERVMESETPMVVFGEKLENIGAISDNTSKSLNETGKSISDGLMKGMEEADVEAGSENLFSRLIGKIKELFGIHSPSTVMAEIGGFIVEGMLNGIMESLKSIGSWVREHIFQPFIDGFKNAFDIHSPSGVMESMGRYIIEGLLNGLKNMWGSITSTGKTILPAPTPCALCPPPTSIRQLQSCQTSRYRNWPPARCFRRTESSLRLLATRNTGRTWRLRLIRSGRRQKKLY